MSSKPWDVRLRRITWEPYPKTWSVRRRCRILIAIGLPCVVWYFGWLLNVPARHGTPVLYGILIVAELFNLSQGLGFWWTVAHEWVRPRRAPTKYVAVDVFIPVYKEPPDIVDLTIVGAKGMRGAELRVHVLDDGNDPAMKELALRHGVGYITRSEHSGAKAGNINHALTKTDAPFIAVFDADHMADPDFLEATMGWLEDPEIAFVQTPQYYANTENNRIAAASMSQQALFFGPICRGKDGLGAVFCCGTCVVFRREAFESVGGFPTNSLTEDFELSIHLHEKGWKSAYVPDVLSRGVGPEDTAAYISQQQRWARGCLSGVPRALRARLPIGLKIQYLLSGVYWLSGWTLLVYMSFPVVRLLGGGQPIGHINAPEFLLHFVPYYAVALTMAAVGGAGSYKFSAYALSAANFWIQILATFYTVLRKSGSFIVTPKKGADVRQPRAVMPTLVTVGVLVAASIYGLAKNRDAATINNVSFAAVHVSILMTGCWAALQKPPAPAAESFAPAEVGA
jgi:cellulose synthase (UDP-forming)